MDAAELPILNALDLALDDALSGSLERRQEDLLTAKGRVSDLLQVLARSEYVQALGEALEDTDLESIEIWLNEDHIVRRNETLEGSVLLADGELEVRGEVRGDVIVLDGHLVIADGAHVDGDIRLVDSSIEQDGEVGGAVVDVSRELNRARHRLRDEIRTEIREELRRDRRTSRSYGFGSRAARAVGSVFESIFGFVLLGLMLALATRFGGERLDTVARAVKENPTRSAAVGFAGAFLVAPVYILGLLVLTVSIVGIPALLIWAPLFPLAVALGAFVGYVGVGHHIGRWVLGHDFHWLDFVDEESDTQVRLVGLAALLAPFAVAGIIQLLPLVGWMGGLLSALGSIACLTALVMGFGAVIITRGGRYSNYAFDLDVDLNADWSPSDAPEGPLESQDVTEADAGGEDE